MRAKNFIMLQLLHIKKSFQRSQETINVINDFSFAMNEGELVAIKGASGSGKTTLLLTIGALQKPESGEVIINKTNPYLLTSEARANFRAKNIGFIFQQFHLLPYLTVLENVLAANLVVKKKNAKEEALILLQHLNLSHRLTHFPSELSVGERQRVALARAVLNRPKLLLADEPTGNLDAENSSIITNYFKKYAEDGNCVIMVTHDEQAAKTADRIEIINYK